MFVNCAMMSKVVRIDLDANFFIYYIENDTPDLTGVVRRAIAGHWQLVTSEFTLTEVLVAPLRNGDMALANIDEQLREDRGVFELIPVSRSVLRAAARIRASIGNKTPDAIHVATALEEHCAVFLSSDLRIKLPSSIAGVPLDRTADLETLS